MQKFTISPYPHRVEVLGADFGYVTDFRYTCRDQSFFDAIHTFEKKQFGKIGPGKIAVQELHITFEKNRTKLNLKLWDNVHTFEHIFDSDDFIFERSSDGGNLNNIMRNWDEILSVLKDNIDNMPTINFYAVGDTTRQDNHEFDTVCFHNIEGTTRQAYIISNPLSDDMISFVIPRADVATPHHINDEMPSEAAYFLVGNHPYTSKGHLEFLVDHIERYPESKIFFIPSTIQIHDGYKMYENFLEKVYAMACNVSEAYTFLGWQDPIVDPEKSAEKVANHLHNIGIKHVVLTHGKYGMLCSVRNHSLKPSCQNWDPIIDIHALLSGVPETITYLDENKSIPVHSKSIVDVTGCGDAFTSGVFLYELINPTESCDKMIMAKYLAALKAIYPYSNLHGINKELLSFVLHSALDT
jgi:sugar/nucleoside kinase (ribokinase family)